MLASDESSGVQKPRPKPRPAPLHDGTPFTLVYDGTHPIAVNLMKPGMKSAPKTGFQAKPIEPVNNSFGIVSNESNPPSPTQSQKNTSAPITPVNRGSKSSQVQHQDQLKARKDSGKRLKWVDKVVTSQASFSQGNDMNIDADIAKVKGRTMEKAILIDINMDDLDNFGSGEEFSGSKLKKSSNNRYSYHQTHFDGV